MEGKETQAAGVKGLAVVVRGLKAGLTVLGRQVLSLSLFLSLEVLFKLAPLPSTWLFPGPILIHKEGKEDTESQ